MSYGFTLQKKIPLVKIALVLLAIGIVLFMPARSYAAIPPVAISFTTSNTFGEVFPGEEAVRLFTVAHVPEPGDEDLTINYSFVLESQTASPLCPLLSIASREDEGDTHNSAAIGSDDTLDLWRVHLVVPGAYDGVFDTFDCTIRAVVDAGNGGNGGDGGNGGGDGNGGNSGDTGGGSASVTAGTSSGGGGGGGIATTILLTIGGENVRVIDPRTGTVEISWKTNLPATSQIIFGPVEAGPYSISLLKEPYFGYPLGSERIGDKVTLHSIVLTGLIPNIEYAYRAVSSASPPTLGLERRFTVSSVDGTPSLVGLTPPSGVTAPTVGGGSAVRPTGEGGRDSDSVFDSILGGGMATDTDRISTSSANGADDDQQAAALRFGIFGNAWDAMLLLLILIIIAIIVYGTVWKRRDGGSPFNNDQPPLFPPAKGGTTPSPPTPKESLSSSPTPTERSASSLPSTIITPPPAPQTKPPTSQSLPLEEEFPFSDEEFPFPDEEDLK